VTDIPCSPDPITVPDPDPGTDPSCTVALDANGDVVVTYADFDGGGVVNVFVRRDGKWLATMPVGTGSYTDSTAAPGDHSYVIRWRPGGVRTDVPCTPDPITVPDPDPGNDPTCTVELDANDDPVLTWDDAGVATYNVRDETGWVATVTGATTFTDTGAFPGDHSYVVRYNPGGGAVDIPCSPDPITVPTPAGPTCSALLNAAGEVELTWDAVPGVDEYVVRDNSGWVATVTDTSYIDTAPGGGELGYTIRFWNPSRTDVVCEPNPIVP